MAKVFWLIGCIGFFTLILAAGDKGRYLVVDQNGSKSYVNFMTQIPKSIRGKVKVGYENKNGKTIIEPMYDSISVFDNGYAFIELDQRFGFVAESGKVIFEPQFDEVGDNIHGGVIVASHSKYGYIELVNGKIILPLVYDDIKRNQDGTFLLKLNNKWGKYDPINKQLVDSVYESIESIYFIGLENIRENVYLVKKNGCYGIIDRDFKSIIEPKYEALSFYGGETGKYKLTGKWGYIGQSGNELTEPIFDRIEDLYVELSSYAADMSFEEQDKLFLRYLDRVKYNGKYGIYNRHMNKMILKPEYDKIDCFRILNNSFAQQYLHPRITPIAIRVPIFRAIKKGIIIDDKFFYDLNGNYIDKL